MSYPKNMLVQSVRESHGETFEPIQVKRVPGERKLKGRDLTYKRVAKLVPVGVFVGMNDHGCIRTGWSRCKLPPAVIPEAHLKLMRPDVQSNYRREVAESDTFKLDRGVTEAMRNMMFPVPPPKGRGFADKYARFQQRCQKYFKDADMVMGDDNQFRVVVRPGVNAFADFGTRNRRGVRPSSEALADEILRQLKDRRIFKNTSPHAIPPVPNELEGFMKAIQDICGPLQIYDILRMPLKYEDLLANLQKPKINPKI